MSDESWYLNDMNFIVTATKFQKFILFFFKKILHNVYCGFDENKQICILLNFELKQNQSVGMANTTFCLVVPAVICTAPQDEGWFLRSLYTRSPGSTAVMISSGCGHGVVNLGVSTSFSMRSCDFRKNHAPCVLPWSPLNWSGDSWISAQRGPRRSDGLFTKSF